MTKISFERTETLKVIQSELTDVHRGNARNASGAKLFLTCHANGVIGTEELIRTIKEDAERRLEAAPEERSMEADLLASKLMLGEMDDDRKILTALGGLGRRAIYHRSGNEPVSFAELVASTYGDAEEGFPSSGKIDLALKPLQEFKTWQEELAAQAEAATVKEQA